MSQRGAIAHAGTMDLKASADIRIALGVTQTSEMTHVVPDWQEIGAPDMSKYGEGHEGVVLITAAKRPWQAGRDWFLDLDSAEKISKRRGAPKGRLEARIAAKIGEPYATRRVAAPVPAVAAAAGSVSSGGSDDSDTYDGDPHLAGQFRSVAESIAVIDQAAADVAKLQRPPEQHVSLEALIAARNEKDQGMRIPDDVREAVLRLLTERGDKGAPRRDIVALLAETCDKGESSTVKYLRAMTKQGLVTTRGTTVNAVYLLPEHAGEGQ
jgi:hypothetical protein